MSRKCLNHPDSFCYICGSYVLKKQREKISNFVCRAYFAYFDLKLGDQDKPWAPHIACHTCVAGLRKYYNGKQAALNFGVPMVWREQVNHFDDCYFCLCNLAGYNKKNKKDIEYPNLRSAIRPIPHGPDVPLPKLRNKMKCRSMSDSTASDEDKSSVYMPSSTDKPQTFTQGEINNLVRDLGLSKKHAELLGSRLQEKHLLKAGVTFSWYRQREDDFKKFFVKEDLLVYCHDISNLFDSLGLQYKSSDWRLFIDASKRSLKAVLLHNSNIYSSVPVCHSVLMKETYDNLRIILNKLNYNMHEWAICGDLKVIGILLGLQKGYTKMPCFLCEWDSRCKEQHWTRKQWPPRENLTPGQKNVISIPLVPPQKVLLPPLHIKLGIIKQFVKALNKDGQCFKHMCNAFPELSTAKLNEGIFIGPQIRTLMKNKEFEDTMTDLEKRHGYLLRMWYPIFWEITEIRISRQL